MSAHQSRKGSRLLFISGTTEPESGYSSKFDTSPMFFTTGTYFGFIFFFIKSSQLKLLNQRCFFMSFTPSLTHSYRPSSFHIFLTGQPPTSALSTTLLLLPTFRTVLGTISFLSRCSCKFPSDHHH